MRNPFPRPLPIICQVIDVLPAQCCGAEADSGGKRCEAIGPHTKHAVGWHTIEHERLGNGHSCLQIERLIQMCTPCYPHGPAEACACAGCWACTGYVVACTCDINWDCEHVRDGCEQPCSHVPSGTEGISDVQRVR